jgi:uncharacterized protein (TIGR00661 family)
MATVVYSVCGEGRGHATRVLAMVDELKRHHRVTILAAGDARPLLSSAFEGSGVPVRPIPALRFHYTAGRRLASLKTALAGLGYLSRLPDSLHRVRRLLEREQPDLVISDFEPLLPRAARRLGIPSLSIDHQHFLLVNDLGSLPPRLRRRAALMALVVRCYDARPRHLVVSSFYRPPLRPGLRRVTQVGVLLRQEIRRMRPSDGSYLVAYLRRFASPSLLAALAACGREIRVYGLGRRPRDGSLRFMPVDGQRFAEDLAHSAAVICTAGNQLVGEALYLGKPVFVLPEEGNFEQFINAHFLAAMGAGTWKRLESVTAADIGRFLHGLEGYRGRIDRRQLAGNRAALGVVDRFLPALRDQPEPAAAASDRLQPALSPAAS